VYGTVQGVFAMVQSRRLWGLAAVLLLVLAAPVRAGGPAGPATQIETELRRTDTLLDRARDEVAGVRGAFAHERLRHAVETQRKAWVEFRRPAHDLRRVVALTREARAQALKAIEAAGIERRAAQGVSTLLDRAEQRGAEIEPAVRASSSDLAARLYDQGRRQLLRARRAWGESDPLAARLASLAQSLFDRAGRVAAGEGAVSTAAASSIARTEALLAEADARLAQEAAASETKTLRAAAGDLLDRAREALRHDAQRAALRLSLQARESALRLLARLQRQPTGAELLPALEDLEALRGEIAPEIAASGDPRARDQLEQSGALLETARQLLAAGRIEEAVAELAAAESLLREAADAAGVR
jgi:hypothetical protein